MIFGTVNKAGNKYLVVWGPMGVVGLGLRFATSADFAHGLGIALVLLSGVGLMVDGFAERRAHAYAATLGGVAGAAAPPSSSAAAPPR